MSIIHKPSIIAVSGSIGVGKTTIARALATEFGWTYIPDADERMLYLSDLCSVPKRWAFEAQVAVLSSKTAMLVAALAARPSRIIVERTLEEDVEVFARFWRDSGKMDDRAFVTYSALAQYFAAQVPSPDVVLYCEHKPRMVDARLRRSGGPIRRLFSSSDLRQLAALYDEWISDWINSPVVTVDLEAEDCRRTRVARKIGESIVRALSYPRQDRAVQLELFERNCVADAADAAKLGRVGGGPRFTVDVTKADVPGVDTWRPRAYIAAPFTGQVEVGGDGENGLFGIEPGPEIIRQGRYRTMLLGMAQALRGQGFWPVLPHKDISRWGRRNLSPSQVMEACTIQVAVCDVFVGVLGSSCGAHYEFGVARGLGKPSVIIECDEVVNSFVAKGVRTSEEVGRSSLGRMLALRCKTIDEIPTLLGSREARSFLGCLERFDI